MNESRQALIEVEGMIAWVNPAVEELIGLLTHRATRFVAGGPTGLSRRTKNVLFCAVESDGRLRIPAGAVPTAISMLERAGYAVTVSHSGLPRVPVDPEILVGMNSIELELLEAFRKHPRGMLKTRGRGSVELAIKVLVQLFPTGRILIVAATKQQVGGLLHDLNSSHGIGAKVFDHAWKWDEDRICIVTLSLFRGGFNPDYWDIVVFTNAVETINQTSSHKLIYTGQQRVYAFLRGDREFRGRQLLEAWTLVGPIIYRQRHPQGDVANVRVVTVVPPRSEPVDVADALDRKRQSVWHNEARNDCVAGLATALCDGDKEEQRKLGVFLTPQGPDRVSVSIVVESAEHGRELQGRLPSWTLRHEIPSNPGVPPELPVSPFIARPFHRVIMTSVWASRLENLTTDFLIRADGSEWPLGLLGFPPRYQDGDHQAILVDFDDSSDSDSQRATRRRQADYSRRSWMREAQFKMRIETRAF